MLMSFVLPFIEFEDGVSNPLLLFHSTFSLVFFWSTHLTRDPITRPGQWPGWVSKLWLQYVREALYLSSQFFFSPKLSFSIWFFNIELVKNYSYNMWGKHCTLHRKLLWIDTVFFPIKFFFLFFYVFFLKLSLLILFF
jgi:hypothetical protein